MISTYVKSIGEIAIRVKNMDRMVDFYVELLGFELRRRFENDVAAIKLADGYHNQIHTLTLFNENLPGNFKKYNWPGLDNKFTNLHHFALTIVADDYDEFIHLLNEKNIPYDTATHRWTGWKGIYLQDPELNILEFVCYDERFDEGKTGAYDFNKLHGSTTGKEFL